MPTFAAFSDVAYHYVQQKDSAGLPVHTHQQHQLCGTVSLINMDHVRQIKLEACKGIPGESVSILTFYDGAVTKVATRELDAWLNDNPQFGGRSRLHLIDQEGDH